MKTVKINLLDVLAVLEAMKDSGTQDILVFDHEGIPAIADANEPENMVTFTTFDGEEEMIKDGEELH